MPDATTSPPDLLEDRIGRIAHRLGALGGWRRAGTALAAGAVSVLAMPPFMLWPVLIFTLPVLVWLINGAVASSPPPRGWLGADWRRLARVAVVGWCFGLGFHVAGLYWLREAFLVTGGRMAWLWPLGVLGLPAYLAVYHGMAAIFAILIPAPGWRRAAALAVGLGVSEWLRGHMFTGFPWNVLGMALTWPLTLMQSAGVLGIYGLTVIAVLALAMPLCMLADRGGDWGGDGVRSPWRWRCISIGALVVPFCIMLVYGTLRLNLSRPNDVTGVRLRLVQPSIPQLDKWIGDKQPQIIARHIELTLRDAAGRKDDLAGITHVVWPEAAMPFLPLDRPHVLDAIGEALPQGVHLLAGVLRLERRVSPKPGEAPLMDQGDRAHNSLAVFADDGRPVTVYDKAHLVPFGEYLPFQALLESLGLSSLTRQRGGFSLGPTPRPLLTVPGLPGVGPLICYEVVFPGTSAASIERPQVLINITNDGWFGNTTGPRQHLHQARLRSVEEGIPLMRVANNGISAVYDGFGRELARLDLDVAGVIDTALPGRTAAPIYARLGELPFTLLGVIVLLSLLQASSISNKP